MKKLSVYFIFFFISGISLAQSKKETIVILTNRVDSLNQIVANERSIVISERSDKQILNSEISNLKRQIKELERNKQNLSNDKNALETKNNALNQELQENKNLKEVLKKQLKIKQDSLMLVTTELLKYRPAPKQELVVNQDNTGPIKTVTIGTQVWMLENLNLSTFKNGVAIPEVQDNEAWTKAGKNKQPAWCYYNNVPGVKYGKLYNWYAVINTNGLCPQGWHVPSDAEWTVLMDYLGGGGVAGNKMKEVGEYWSSGGYTTEPTNTSLFTGLPGGYRNNRGYCSTFGNHGFWWSSTENNTDNAWYRYLSYFDGNARRCNNGIDEYGFEPNKFYGFSVRCLKD